MTGGHFWEDRWKDSGTIFEGLSSDYDRYRPSYSTASIDWLGKSGGMVRCLADIASGTGILTRQLRATFRQALVVGIEPGSDMLEKASASGSSGVHWLAGRAEALPLADGSVDLATVGQALHWFDRTRFCAECARVLRPGGRLAILYNNRIRDSAIAETFEAALEAVSPGYRRGYRDLDVRRGLEAFPGTRDVKHRRFAWSWDLTIGDFLGYVRSTSHFKAALRFHSDEEVLAVMHKALVPHGDAAGILRIPYETEVTTAVFS